MAVHGGGGGRAEVHVAVQVAEVGRRGDDAAVGLVTAVGGGGRLDDRTAAARERGGGRARGHGEMAVGRRADGRPVAVHRRRVAGHAAVRICGQRIKWKS